MDNQIRYINNNEIKNTTEDEIDLIQLFNTIMKQKKFIVLFTSILTILSIIYVQTKTPIYEIKSNLQIGYIGKNLLTEPSTLIKTANIVFNVEDKIKNDNEFISEVTSISSNKKLKNFIEIKTQAISNKEALKKNKEVVKFIQNKYKHTIDQFILNNNYNIKYINFQISNLENLETNNLKQKIKIIKTQNIPNITNKIDFYNTVKLPSLKQKISYHTDKLEQYTKSINQLYQNNVNNVDKASLTILSIQMLNYQNLILNSQNKIEDLKIQIEIIKNETIKNLELKNKNIQDDTLRKLNYELNIVLKNKKIKLEKKISQHQFKNSINNIQNQ